MRVGKVDGYPRRHTETGVSGHFFSLVPGKRTRQVLWEADDVGSHGVGDVAGGLVLELDEHAEARSALHQGGYGAQALLPDDQVPLRKTMSDLRGPGVAEVALRLERSLGMSTRPF